MSCNCNGCGQPERLCRCPKGKGEAPKRAYIAECTDCDPCRPCESMVKICSFVTPTLTEGQKFRNSFVYNQEDDSVYYISDDGTPTRFGSSPMFINAFNPDDRKIPRQTVFDFANQKAYIYDPEGNYITVNLAGDTSAKKLHVYCPVVSNYMSATASSVRLAFGPEIENPSITIKDDDGNDVSPEDFAALGGELADYAFVVHIPNMGEVGPVGDKVIVPEQEFVVKPTYSGLTSDDGRLVDGSGYQESFWGIVQKGTYYYSAEFTVYAYRGA